MPRPHPKEFREGAIALARHGARSIPDIAGELRIAASCCATGSSRTSSIAASATTD